MSLYPVNLDISGMLCLVIGGGRVASRKVDSLLPCGAVIRVISPEVDSRIAKLAQGGLLDWQQRAYKKGDLAGAQLVFAATDSPEVQGQIVSEATAALIPVNVIDKPEACTFQVPASFRQGRLLLTVATEGGSPALAARIKRDLEDSYGPEYALLVDMMSSVRKDIVASSDSPAEHKKIFEKLLADEVMDCIRKQQWDELNTLLQHILPAAIDIISLVNGMRNHKKEQIL